MNLNIAFGLALIITCVLAFGICAFSRWHSKRYVRLPPPQRAVFRDAYNHYAVGNDAKAFGEDTQ